jgi:hypothetical protein
VRSPFCEVNGSLSFAFLIGDNCLVHVGWSATTGVVVTRSVVATVWFRQAPPSTHCEPDALVAGWTTLALNSRVSANDEALAVKPHEWRNNEMSLEQCRAECNLHSTCIGIEFQGGRQTKEADEIIGCEHDTVKLSCASGVIDVISASYGRHHSGAVCKHPATSNQKCHSKASVAIVKQQCQGKKSCAVKASNGVFGDPCGGTFKYLTANYRCVNAMSDCILIRSASKLQAAAGWTVSTKPGLSLTQVCHPTHILSTLSLLLLLFIMCLVQPGKSHEGIGGFLNPNFEDDGLCHMPGATYKYLTPKNWQSRNTALVCNRNAAWGGLDSHAGSSFLSVQGAKAYAEQTIAGLTAGQSYEVSFLATHRPGYGNDEQLRVLADGKEIWHTSHPGTSCACLTHTTLPYCASLD